MTRLKLKNLDALILEPEDEDLLAVLKFTRKTFLQDVMILNSPTINDPESDLTRKRLKEAADAIKKVLPYYTVGGGPVE